MYYVTLSLPHPPLSSFHSYQLPHSHSLPVPFLESCLTVWFWLSLTSKIHEAVGLELPTGWRWAHQGLRNWRPWFLLSLCLSVANNSVVRGGPMRPSPIHPWVLTGPFSYRSIAGILSCFEFMTTVAVSFPGDDVSKLVSVSPGSYILSTQSSIMFLKHYRELYVCVSCSWLSTHWSFILSTFSGHNLCIHHCSMKTEGSLIKAEGSACLRV